MPGDKIVNAEFSGIEPNEFRELAERAGFPTTIELAQFFGVKDRTVSYWYAGKKDIPIAQVMVLAMMVRARWTPEHVRMIVGDGGVL